MLRDIPLRDKRRCENEFSRNAVRRVCDLLTSSRQETKAAKVDKGTSTKLVDLGTVEKKLIFEIFKSRNCDEYLGEERVDIFRE